MALADIEIKATMNEYRPCTVFYEGKKYKALFHRWTDKEKMVVKFNRPYHPSHMESIKRHFEEAGIAPPDTDVHIHRECCALVEFEDGRVELVPAESVIFLDSKEKFAEYCWDEDNTKTIDNFMHICETCKYYDTPINKEPCNVCIGKARSDNKHHPKWEARE